MNNVLKVCLWSSVAQNEFHTEFQCTFQNVNARAEMKKIPIKDLGMDKESVISDSYGESFNDSHSPDPHDYYSRYKAKYGIDLGQF